MRICARSARRHHQNLFHATRGWFPYLVVVPSSEEDWDESEPDDAGAVHGEADVLGLVEVLRDLPGLESVPGAQEDEGHVVDEGENEGHCRDAAGLDSHHVARVDHLVWEQQVIYKGYTKVTQESRVWAA